MNGPIANEGRSARSVRRSINQRLAEIEDLDQLQVIELVAYLPEYPFSYELGLEILTSVSTYIALARQAYEDELAVAKAQHRKRSEEKPWQEN